MWEDILNLAIGNGLWAVLFVFLLVYVLKDSRAREKNYQILIDSLSDALNIVKEVQDDVKDIKEEISLNKKKMKGKDNDEKIQKI